MKKLGPSPKNFLLTGPPRCGKTTLIEKIICQLNKPLRGFFTREIKSKGQRVGFSIITLDGKKRILAHEESNSRVRVSKYGVNIDEVEKVAVPSMIPTNLDEIVVIDEIGKMECFSPLFRGSLVKVLDSKNIVIGSISQKGSPFIQKIKERPDVTLVMVSEKNRDSLLSSLLRAIANRGQVPKPENSLHP